ncbi:MAG TPA: HEAT repeat domain-containing protein [Spirochaetota bacterium]|nr:HEAT repeat domain-containing protein [Spirochaetota bacterium]
MSLFRPNIEKFISENNIPGLIKCTTYRDPEVRLKAFLNLVAREEKTPEIINALRKMKNDKDVRVRNAAILKLAEVGDEGILDDLHSIMVEGSQNDKIDALRILADRGKTDAQASSLIVLALNDKKGMVQLEAIRTLGALKDHTSIVHLEEKLHDTRHQIRLEAVKALGAIQTDDAIELLIGSLTDNKLEIRRAAREIMESIGTDRAKKALNDAPLMMMVKRMNEGVASKVDALTYIGKHRFADALPLVHKATSDEYKNVRFEAVKALAQMRDRGSINTLARMINDPYFDIRLEAVKALERIIDPASLKPLEKAKEDLNKSVREEAKKAYYTIQTKLEDSKKK